MINCYKMRLVVIALPINTCCSSYRSDFHRSDCFPEAIHFIHELHAQVIGVAIETRYYSHKFDLHRSDWYLKQFILLINCTLGFTIYLGPNAVIIAGPFSHKSTFIYHFKITVLSRKIVL